MFKNTMNVNRFLFDIYHRTPVFKDYLGVRIQRITGVQIPAYKSNPCFFLSRELGKSADELIATQQYRHCKIYLKNRDFMFLDYIVKKEFNTLEDWVADCGATMNDIMYGFNKFDGVRSYVTLQQLISYLAPQDVEEVTNFMRRLNVTGLTLQSVLVVKKDPVMVQTYSDFMKE